LEESHYYPFGLIQQGISSKALAFGGGESKERFQGQELAHKEFSDGSGLEMYEFKWRMHDPQTGRFWQIDPLAEKYVYNSTYAFSENKVTGHVELEGLEAVSFGGVMNYLRNAAGYEHTTTKSFVNRMVEVAKDPNTYLNAVEGVGNVVGAGLIIAATDGIASTVTSRMFLSTTTSRISTSEASVTSLEVRAKEIQGVLSPRTQNATTTAVASATTAEGRATTLVASSENSLRKEQLATLKPGEVAVSGKGHAEVTILNHAATNGIQVNAVAASRPICVGCATAISNAGAIPASPLKIIPQATVASTYVRPPDVVPTRN
jgi:RHS repeat-associated protein